MRTAHKGVEPMPAEAEQPEMVLAEFDVVSAMPGGILKIESIQGQRGPRLPEK